MLLWTKSNAPLSRFIRMITGQECSHFSFVFQGPGKSGLMFESNLLGTHPAFLKTSLKTHEIIHQIEMTLPIEDEDQIWDLCVEKYDGKGYDFGGAIYLGLMLLRERLFKIPRPLINKWAKSDSYFCDEIYEVFNHIPEFKKIDVTSGMYTPHDIYINLQGG